MESTNKYICGRDIFKKAMALMAEDIQDAQEYEKHAMDLIITLMAELESFEFYEDAGSLPDIIDLDTTLPIKRKVALAAVSYGLAALLCLDDDKAKAAFFNAKYIENRRALTEAMLSDVCDVYEV